MYLSVQEQEEANLAFKRFETRLSLRGPCAHRTPRTSAESFAKESSVRCCCPCGLSACAPNTARKYSVELFLRLVFECFKLF